LEPIAKQGNWFHYLFGLEFLGGKAQMEDEQIATVIIVFRIP